MLSSSSASKNKLSKKATGSSAWCLLYAGFLLGLFFDPEDGGAIFLQNFS
jgi:hypothetical protein